MATTTKKTTAPVKPAVSNGASVENKRLAVLKTYKIYIGGQFPRTESGRYYTPTNKSGKILANMCLSSRKDFRNAVSAARSAFGGWAAKSAFNRSQILYRIAEMLESRRALFVDELKQMDFSQAQAEHEVNVSIDRLVYYAGWCDKYSQIFSSVNPVASSHFNFSVTEPMGVIAAVSDDKNPLLGLVSVIAPVIAGANTVVVLASESKPLCAISFAEVINDSDVPGGVVNILTGSKKELVNHFASHMDVNALVYANEDSSFVAKIQTTAVDNLKRVYVWQQDFSKSEQQNPYFILDLQEIKTTWHPIENIAGAGGGY
jgi:acyl-CoA reductase-like NAD-dependent aldehyde dehydrogenase